MPRKKPFSSKQKKLQLQDKRRRKKDFEIDYTQDEKVSSDAESSGEDGKSTMTKVRKVNQQPSSASNRKYDPNRYRLHFFKESAHEIQKRKLLARKSLRHVPEEALEIDVDLVYKPGTVLDLPKRPEWDYSLTKEQLDSRELTYFQDYLEKIFDSYLPEDLSYFELNLETWRQLWRVLEMSDVLLLIMDIRYPVLHFSPALYHYVVHELGKSIIVVLNKIDLAPPPLIVAWKHFLEARYPKVNIVYFTSFPKEALAESDEAKAKKRRRRKGGGWITAMGTKQLFDVCQDIVREKVDLSSWLYKITVDADMTQTADEGIDDTCEEEAHQASTDPPSQYELFKDGILTIGCVVYIYPPSQYELFKDGIFTIGCVGYPNVGKSSLLNGLVGRKVVSVSKTPGHTKHFQTIFLTPTVKLCDCPGLVFPSVVEKPLQILAGIYPIAQVREPYTPVGFLSERVDVIKQLNLRHPCSDEEGATTSKEQWSAFDVCEAWAEKRKFYTAKAARPDVYRAANNLLRMALDGRLCLCLRPPGYLEEIDKWTNHPETKKLAEDLEKYVVKEDEDDQNNDDIGEESDEELDLLDKDDNSTDSDDEEETKKKGFASSNPYALLMDDD